MKKTMSKNSSEFDKFGKEFIGLLPMNQFQKVFRQIENFDGKTPETLLEKIKNKSMNFPRISEEKQNSLQTSLLNAIRNGEFGLQMKTGFEQSISFTKDNLKKDSRYSQLINLINKADENVEFISLPFLTPFLNLEQNFILFCKPLKLLKEINNSVGEERKNSLVDLFREIPEKQYAMYLEVIWKLSFLAENRMFSEEIPKPFGNFVCQATNRLKDYSGLVESKIGLLRNSFYHWNFEYNLGDDSFIIWDDNKPKTKITADELAEIANDVTSICADTFPLVAQLYFFRDFFLKSGLLDIYVEKIPALISENSSEVSKAEKELSDFGELLTEPMRNFFQQHQRV